MSGRVKDLDIQNNKRKISRAENLEKARAANKAAILVLRFL